MTTGIDKPNGLATLDVNSQVPLNQLGNIPTATTTTAGLIKVNDAPTNGVTPKAITTDSTGYTGFTNYLRTDSSAPSQQTVEKQVIFSSNPEINNSSPALFLTSSSGDTYIQISSGTSTKFLIGWHSYSDNNFISSYDGTSWHETDIDSQGNWTFPSNVRVNSYLSTYNNVDIYSPSGNSQWSYSLGLHSTDSSGNAQRFYIQGDPNIGGGMYVANNSGVEMYHVDTSGNMSVVGHGTFEGGISVPALVSSTGSYTVPDKYVGGFIEYNSAASTTWTLPSPSGLNSGGSITIWNNNGQGSGYDLTVAAPGSTGIYGPGGGSSTTVLKAGMTITLYSDSYNWIIVGGSQMGTFSNSTSASGLWTPSSGVFNVAVGTVINIAKVPDGAVMYQTVSIPESGNASYTNTWGITTSSGAVWACSTTTGGSYAYTGYSNGISSSSYVGEYSLAYDGSYEGIGYYQINNGYLQFVTVSGPSADTTARMPIRWAVS